MNSRKTVLLGIAAVAAMAPFYTHASTGHIGLQACAEALATELSISSGSSVDFQLDISQDNFDRKLKKRELISLYARDPQSNELVSRMDCMVDSRGRVIRLNSLPLEDQDEGNRFSEVQ